MQSPFVVPNSKWPMRVRVRCPPVANCVEHTYEAAAAANTAPSQVPLTFNVPPSGGCTSSQWVLPQAVDSMNDSQALRLRHTAQLSGSLSLNPNRVAHV